MKWNFSCSALLHTKTIVSLKYFVNDCSWFWYLYMSAKNVRHFWNNSYSGIFFEVSFRGVQNELNLPNSLKFFVYFLQINSTISLLHEKKKKKKKKKTRKRKAFIRKSSTPLHAQRMDILSGERKSTIYSMQSTRQRDIFM